MRKIIASCLFLLFLSNLNAQEKPPLCMDDYVSIKAGAYKEVEVLANDWWMTGHNVNVIFGGNTAGGDVTVANDLIRYSSHYFFEGVDSVPYRVKDLNNGLLSETAYVILTVDNPGKEFLEVNDIRAMINSYGYQFCDITEYTPWFEVPKGSGVSSLFSMTLWLGGKDGSANLHVAAEKYRQIGTDYFNGPFADFYADNYDFIWNKLWKIGREELEDHQHNWSEPGYEMPQDIQNWPAHGAFATGQAPQLAPYIDWNGDKTYQPEWGDMPAVRGDQSLFFMYNDDYDNHTESGGTKIGVDVMGQAYGFDCPDDSVMNQTLFVHYDIINRSDQSYFQFCAGIYADFDLGFAWDDYVGCDTNLQAMYVFNGDNEDEISTIWGGTGYGTAPPAMAIVFLDQPLSAFVVPSNVTGPASLPYEDDEYYNNLRGLWRDGTEIMYEGSPTRLMYTGDPVANTGWTESLSGNAPNDRRVIGSVEPVDLLIGDTLSIDLGLIWARDYEGDNISSLAVLKERIQELRWYYENDSLPCGGKWLTVPEKQQNQTTFSVYPNPAKDFLNINLTDHGRHSYWIHDCFGRTVRKGVMSQQKQIDISGLSEGIYFLTLSDQTNSTTKKFLKR